jgi:cellulose synthase/poly-beta-1,6-N-acetylglucosamine synthase-like glycosyltransferase
MIFLAILQIAVTVYVTAWLLYLFVLPIAAGFKVFRTDRQRAPLRTALPQVSIIIPAYNMSNVIDDCIASIHDDVRAIDHVSIYVVADHCTDDTAERAIAAGANVLTRHEGARGKTYTLAWTLDQLSQLNVEPDLYVVVDATAQVSPGFFKALIERWQQGEDIMTSRATLSSTNQKWFARCLGLMLIHRYMQGWYREQLGLSAWLEGRGMAYSRGYIQQFGWRLALPSEATTSHPTEDWRHGVRAAEQGYRIAFAPDAKVITPLRRTFVEATKQNARWERGRFINAITYALRLLWQGIKQRKALKIFAALDGIQPPVALLGGVACLLALWSFCFPKANAAGLWAFLPVGLVGVYSLIVAYRGHVEGIHFITLFWAPIYVVWRCSAFVLAWVFLDHIDALHSPRKAPEKN